MSQENVDVVRAILEALSREDRDAVIACVDPECVVDATRQVFNPATYVGIDGVRQLFSGMDESWEEMRVEPREFIDAGDRVVVIGRLFGRGKGSGVTVERFNGQVWTVRDRLVVRLEIGYTDREAILEAVRPRESPADESN
jgi:ketosteroid isomerase-like protein